ncbi:RHS repeat-associated core domain-containing protein [Halioxenophilus sp. WMMB6]|uniref:RHS repeat domain-containing protein n=1 Tax=Halioxenophilus sp. WMMB6 TaxID=3073815 RepID=UPI00295E2212|nr:RHS repeat-associated core domain-containing protein [Halioxenophilus sp. WMMB6]
MTCKATLTLLISLLFIVVGRAEAKVTYYHTDQLGSPIMVTDAQGGVVSRSHYQPFGAALDGLQQDVGYTGHQQDFDLNLVYAQARYYNPEIGRFYSDDPVGFRDIHSFNRYAYANSNPYRFVDPTGQESSSLQDLYRRSVSEHREGLSEGAGDQNDDAQEMQSENGPSLWERINPFSEQNLKLKHAELQKYCEPNCTNSISPEMAETFSELTGGTLGAAGLGRLPSAAGRLTVTKPNVNVDGKFLCLAGSLCAMTTTNSGNVVLDGTVDDVVRVLRQTENIRRRTEVDSAIRTVIESQ